jgi:Holliday junction resolvase RusA-like endonuclease
MRLYYSGDNGSVNEYLIRDRRKYCNYRLHPNYRKFIDALTLIFRKQGLVNKWQTITIPVNVTIYCLLPKAMDTANIDKPVLDALQHALIIKNDNLIRNVELLRDDRHAEPKTCKLVVNIYLKDKEHRYGVLDAVPEDF